MSVVDLEALLDRVGIELDAQCVERLSWLASELVRWNAKRNLTAITEPLAVCEKHLVDSLLVLPWLSSAATLLDLGSGAGFPALPIKIARPELRVVSLDAVAKKIAFQRHVARSLALDGFSAVHARAEEYAAEPGQALAYDLVVARAMTSLERFVGLAAPYLAAGGRLLAMKGAEGREEMLRSQGRLEEDGWSIAYHDLRLPLSAARRCLLVMQRSE